MPDGRGRIHGPRLGETPGGGPSGAASLISAAAILALVAFAAMCIASASADARILVRETRAETEWREADAAANEILGYLRAGLDTSGYGIDVRNEDGIYSYQVPAGTSRLISVRAKIGPDGYEILSWRTERSAEWNPDLDIGVWNGD